MRKTAAQVVEMAFQAEDLKLNTADQERVNKLKSCFGEHILCKFLCIGLWWLQAVGVLRQLVLPYNGTQTDAEKRNGAREGKKKGVQVPNQPKGVKSKRSAKPPVAGTQRKKTGIVSKNRRSAGGAGIGGSAYAGSLHV